MDSNNITIQPFKFKHLKDLHDMLESNNYAGISDIKMKTLPKIGYIVFIDKVPVAAGFLRRLEPCYAQIDTLASNAYMGAIIRHQGINKIVDTLIEDAKRLKLEGLIAHTNDKGILKRAEDMGFHVISQTIIGLQLK